MALGYYYYRGFRDYDRAIQELLIAQKTLPNSKAILAGVGTIYRRQGKFEEALVPEKKFLAINPRDAAAACDIGTTYMLMRRYADAQQNFDLCTALGPEEASGYYLSADNLILWKGDTKSARAVLNKAPQEKNATYVNRWFWLELYDRNYQAVLELLSRPYANPIRKPLGEGRVYLLMNKPELARSSFETARRNFEKQLHITPDDPELHSQLGIAYAGLGRKEDAIREGKRALELLPVSKDAIWGPNYVGYLANIYVMVGEQNAAIDQIKYLLSIPSEVSVPVLRISPIWDPLRKNPRFLNLLEKYSPNN